MAVFRINKTENYSIMVNKPFKEREMSLKAKGLLAVIFSLPNNWDYSVKGLVAICKENETAINSTLKELKDFGYLSVTKLMPNQTESGRIEYIYDIYEEPFNGEKQEGEKQDLENLGVVFMGVEPNNTNIYNIKSYNKELNTNNKSVVLQKEIFDYWNSKEIVVHKALTQTFIKAIDKALKKYSVEEIKKYIDRYNTVLKDTTYFFDTKWTIDKFLTQSNAIGDFTDEGSKWLSYLNRQEKTTQPKTQHFENERKYSKEELNSLLTDIDDIKF